jgi:hypothetical protein
MGELSGQVPSLGQSCSALRATSGEMSFEVSTLLRIQRIQRVGLD